MERYGKRIGILNLYQLLCQLHLVLEEMLPLLLLQRGENSVFHSEEEDVVGLEVIVASIVDEVMTILAQMNPAAEEAVHLQVGIEKNHPKINQILAIIPIKYHWDKE